MSVVAFRLDPPPAKPDEGRVDPVVKHLRRLLWGSVWVNRWGELAKKAGVSYTTVRNIAETTKFPRNETIEKLAPIAFGIERRWFAVGTNQEVHLETYRVRKRA